MRIRKYKIRNEEHEVADLRILKAQLNQQLFMISQPNEKVMDAAWQRWDSIGKPLRSLGAMERAVVKMAGMENSVNVKMDKRAIVVLCGDHGVVKEGVTQTDSSVTRIVADNIAAGRASINIMAAKAGADVFPVDVGMLGEHYPNKEFKQMVMCDRKVSEGNGEITLEPAMTQEQCVQALLAGIEVVADLSTQGYEMIGMGEMGIGNTTPSSALVSVLLNLPANEVTGRGAGLSDEAYNKKVAVIEQAVDRYWKATENSEIPEGPFFKIDAAVELMSHLGGYEIAAMAGMCLGGAVFGVPIVLDGYISVAGALCASLINSDCTSYLLASHISAEPAAWKVLRNLHLEPVIQAGMCLGEGTGAAAAMSLYDMGLAVYRQMGTFEDIHVTQYENYAKKQAEK